MNIVSVIHDAEMLNVSLPFLFFGLCCDVSYFVLWYSKFTRKLGLFSTFQHEKPHYKWGKYQHWRVYMFLFYLFVIFITASILGVTSLKVCLGIARHVRKVTNKFFRLTALMGGRNYVNKVTHPVLRDRSTLKYGSRCLHRDAFLNSHILL
jgi:hypothetical protein